MRHRVAGRRLSRSGGHRKALYRNLITDLFRHERIQTTEAKARAIRSQAEKLITLSRRGQVDSILELAQANDEQGLAALVQTKRAKKLVALAGEAQALSGDEQEAKEAELEQSIRKTVSIIEDYEAKEWPAIPEYERCSKCPINECTERCEIQAV
jgi:ribosomal protein L17